MAGVPRGQGGLSGGSDTGDLDVPYFYRPPLPALVGRNGGCGLCRVLVERKHAAFKLLLQRLGERLLQAPPLAAVRQCFNAEADPQKP